MNPSSQPVGGEEQPPDDWIRLATYPSFRRADERALVLLATSFDPWLSRDDSGFHLFVPASQQQAALGEIHAYEQEIEENESRQAPAIPPPAHSGAWSISFLLAILIVCFAGQKADPGITEKGLNVSRKVIENHEWWRPFTALFLHQDFAHLLGNLAAMALFGALLIRSIGPALAFPAILLSGTIGNLLNIALYYPEEHHSLGASTAVFGALGILAACGFMELARSRSRLPWRRIMVPLVGGLALLGLMGGGSPGSNTDVGAHIAGFVAGVFIGWLIRLVQPGPTDPASP